LATCSKGSSFKEVYNGDIACLAWLNGFCSRQKKINMKSKRLEERMPQIRNFHWYTIYQMATEDP